MRLVLVIPRHGIAVYEGRKPVAFVHTDYIYEIDEIEEMRTFKVTGESHDSEPSDAGPLVDQPVDGAPLR